MNDRKLIWCDSELCRGCHLCSMVCSMEKHGTYSLYDSRIRVLEDIDHWFRSAVACGICSDNACVDSCPEHALSLHEGVLKVDSELCTGCGICARECLYGCISIDKSNKLAKACDLCSGEPKCVEVCPWGALSLMDNRDIKQRQIIKTRKKAVLPIKQDL